MTISREQDRDMKKIWSVSLVAAIAAGVLATTLVFAASAMATPTRSYVGQITGFENPEALALTPNDDIWVSDVGTAYVSEYGPYPANNQLAVRTGEGAWTGSQNVHSFAVSVANDFLYANTEPPEARAGSIVTENPFVILDDLGRTYLLEFPGISTNARWVAVDNNPQDDAYGRYYKFAGGSITMYDGYGNPVPFSGTASYIEGSTITGTPKGSFDYRAAGDGEPSMSGITVDGEGNIWIINTVAREIDEFDSTGLFVQRITEPSSGVPESETQTGKHVWGGYPGMTGIAIDPTNGHVLVSEKTAYTVYEFSPQGKYLGQIDGADTPAGSFGHECYKLFYNEKIEFCFTHVDGVAVDSHGYLYVADGLNGVVDIFGPAAPRPTVAYKADTNPTPTSATVNAMVDPHGAGNITSCKVEYGTKAEFKNQEFKLGPVTCTPDPSGTPFSSPTEVHAELAGLTSEEQYHYRIALQTGGTTTIAGSRAVTPHKVLGLIAEPATAVTASQATLHGSFVGNGAHTTYWFEYGTDTEYGTKAPLPAPPGGDAGFPSGPGRTAKELTITGLKPVTRYHYRIVAENGSTSESEDLSFRTAPIPPDVAGERVDDVHSAQINLHATVVPGGADTVYNFEYGTEPCSTLPNPCSDVFASDRHIGSNFAKLPVNRILQGLSPGTVYYYRAVATNLAGTSYGPDRRFSTFPYSSEIVDPCQNALARQQTGSALVTDCRAYELASSAHAGGYDVESGLVPGQTPFGGYPRAESPLRALYGIHSGAIPGVSGNPTNHGVDPYVATRDPKTGWSTRYVGIPANNPNSSAPFASTLLEADPALDTFAFGGADICSPCFSDNSTGLPVHRADGTLEQGMHGSIEQTTASPGGIVKKHFSGNGKHFIFGSTAQFEGPGNSNGTDVTIYDRNLSTGTTQVASTLPGGGTIAAGSGVAELDVSQDGSRIVVGEFVEADSAGNKYWHLYMHVGSSPNSIDLTPGASHGVLYDGMTDDGTMVYFTTRDALSADTDSSADIYRADVGSSSATLTRVSVGASGTGDMNGCDPAGNTYNSANWNVTPGGPTDCSVVAVGGGGGVARGDGTVYFFSPERLDSSSESVDGAPNLYIARPGSAPHFVAYLESTAPTAVKPAANKLVHSFGSFTNPEGVAIDPVTGASYVLDTDSSEFSGGAFVQKFDSSGHVDTSFGTGGKLDSGPYGEFLDIGTFEYGVPISIAVDTDPTSPSYRDLYVSDIGNFVIYKFDPSGNFISEVPGFYSLGLAVDPSNGDLYTASYFGSVEVFDANGNFLRSFPIPEFEFHDIGVDSTGTVYLTSQTTGTSVYTSTGELIKTLDPNPSYGVRADPVTDDVYIDQGDKIVVYDSSGTKVDPGFGEGTLSQSASLGVYGGRSIVSNRGHGDVSEFWFHDSPLVVDSVRDPAKQRSEDFQVTPSGDFSVFPTTLTPSYENEGHTEIYRYDASGQSADCVSCPPTNAPATGDASLTVNGLNLADDGRVFFDTEEGIVLRDGDKTKDVYEWEKEGTGPLVGGCDPGNTNFFPTGICLSLISTGTSQFDSSLLSVTADGNDAFFFTHDSLAHEDENGPVTKLYDARTDGGFFSIPPPALCAASDECHGPGSKEAATPPIRTIAGTPGNEEGKCKKPRVKRNGKCVRVRKHRKHKRHHHRRAR